MEIIAELVRNCHRTGLDLSHYSPYIVTLETPTYKKIVQFRNTQKQLKISKIESLEKAPCGTYLKSLVDPCYSLLVGRVTHSLIFLLKILDAALHLLK